MRVLFPTISGLYTILILSNHHLVDAGTFRGSSRSSVVNSNTTTTANNTADQRRLNTCSAQTICNSGACCSQWGHCGYSDAHCGAGSCVSGCPGPEPTPPPTTQPPPTDNTMNIAINPGFENSLLDPWYANYGAGTGVQIDTTTKHSGTQSVFVKDRAGTWNGVEQSLLVLGNGGVVPNEAYRVSCWVKLKNTVSDTLVKMTLRIEDDVGGEAWVGISQTITNNDWNYVEGELTVAVGVGELAGVYLYVNGPNSGVEYWVDDVSVVLASGGPSPTTSVPTKRPTQLPTNLPTHFPTNSPTPSPTNSPLNKVLNSGFENGLTQWTRKNGQIQLDTTDSHSGSQSVLCLGRTASHHGVQQNMLSGSSSGSPRIVPNSKYRISCWAKLKNAASDTLRLKVKYEDEDGPHFKGISTVIYNNVWTLLEGYITVDDVSGGGGTISAAKLFVAGPEAGVEFWVDDVSMEFMNAVTSAPTPSPTTKSPTPFPSTLSPTSSPTHGPTTNSPTLSPSSRPTSHPTTLSPTRHPTSSPQTPIPVSPGSCPHDVFNKDICCAESCGSCGGSGCGGRPGGGENCCSGAIRESGVLCLDSEPPCIISEDPTQYPTNAPVTPAPITPSPTISILPTIPTSPPTNLVINPGFEVPNMTPWYANGGTVEIDTTVSHFGAQSVLCKDRTATWMGAEQEMSSGGRVVANAKYHVSCWAKLKNAPTDTFKITMRVEDSAGSDWRGITRTITDEWTFIEGYLTVQGVTGSLNAVDMYLNGPAIGIEYWVDDVSVEFVEALTVSPSNSPVSSATPTQADTAQPTPPPSPPPTPFPSPPPTPPPTMPSQYGNGPFVTHETSSDVVIIPRPPVPNMNEPRTNCPHQETGLLSWHNPNTWGGQVPTSGDVTLPSNSKVVITQSITSELGVITVPSTSELIFDENTSSRITLDVAGMDIQGALRAGSETCRYSSELIITLHGSRPTNLNIYGKSSTAVPTYKGISVNGANSIISVHGKRYYPTWTRLAETVSAGQSYLLVQELVNWESGQEIVLTTTAIHDSREWHKNEVMTIDFIVDSPIPGVGSAIHFTNPVAHAHIANNGYQAEVGLLSRSIKIQGAADDSDPTDPATGSCTDRSHFGSNLAPCPNKYKTGFGGHIIVHSGGHGYVEGVELYRMGQTNVLGRYPFHFHVLGSGCSDCYFKENSIHKSFYRCISIHGTHSTTVSENVAYDVTGYCYYLEDGVEEDNVLSFNLAAHIHPVNNIIANGGGGQTIPVFAQSKDLINPADVTASGFYITNLHNDVIGNACSGGWSGYALPVLHSPIGSHKNVNMRPGNRLTKTFDGNTAHSTGWWWSHAGAIYSGGSLYYSSNYPTRLEYNAGRDQSKGLRSPCLTDYCIANGDCGSYCFEGERSWYQLSNSKLFLTASSGLSSWSGGMEIHGFEAHDVELGLESLSAIGFGINDFFIECRSGEEWDMPGNPNQVSANGFKWYDTNQEHIITSATFKNCGSRKSDNAYDSSSTRGCSTNSNNGCTSTSSVWSFVTHSDQHTPEVMQATSDVTYIDCGRRFRLYDYAHNNNPSSVSGRTQNWMDIDGSTSGLNVPTIIGSGLSDTGHWFRVEDEVVYDPEGPLYFIKKDNGPERSLGHIRLRFDDTLYNSVGKTRCMNGPKGSTQNNAHTLCPTIGRIRHLGALFDSTNDSTGGLPITANAIVSGPTGGFGWSLNLDAGPPKSLRIDQIEIQDFSSPLMLAVPYPQGTGFTITAMVPWCTPSLTYSCTEQFTPASSIAEVRYSQGNKYFYDNITNMLYVRIIMAPQTYTGDNLYSPTAKWHIWNTSDLNNKPYDKRVHALDRYSFNGVTLAKYNTASYLQIDADCNPNSSSKYCTNTPSYVEPQVCPPGYVQVAYDKCCASAGSSNCHDFTAPPTGNPTSPPTFGMNSNLFYNPSFEEGTLTPWYANGGTIQLDNNIKHGSGTTSVLCKSRTATWMGVEQDMLAGGGRFAAGHTYHVSFWAKLKNSGSATVKITMKASYNNGSPTYSSISKNLNNYSWNLIEGDYTLDGAGTLTEAKLYVNGPPGGVEFWVDELSAVLV